MRLWSMVRGEGQYGAWDELYVQGRRVRFLYLLAERRKGDVFVSIICTYICLVISFQLHYIFCICLILLSVFSLFPFVLIRLSLSMFFLQMTRLSSFISSLGRWCIRTVSSERYSCWWSAKGKSNNSEQSFFNYIF